MRYRLLIICTLITFIACFLITGFASADYSTLLIYALIFSILCALSIFFIQKVLSKRNASKKIILLSVFFTVSLSFGGYLFYCITRQTVIEPSQVIYHTGFGPEKLTEGQLKALSSYVDEHKSFNEDVWFVRVLYNNQGDLRAQIFLSPQKQTDRFRQGRYIYCYLLDNQDRPSLFNRIRMLLFYRFNPSSPVYEYCQVSLKDKPFTSSLEIPSQDSLFPFDTPKGFSQQETIDIVDFYRLTFGDYRSDRGAAISEDSNGLKISNEKFAETGQIAIDNMIKDTGSISFSVDGGKIVYHLGLGMINLLKSNRPIKSILRKGQIIELQTGALIGPLVEDGEIFKIEKKNDIYQIIDVSLLVS